ncbi:alpha/beta fold hydrolase [Sphaerisporangium perillae]|uniref:alpha/beta fold hydrolase n=1 Tax=Sphaerisporangium perillae TaxID=2935860 RepID=UPI00200F8A27|nr:alpha/beta hydrolase [Sphaerisporangium perillae]
MKTSTLEVSGASIYYEVRGEGPVLLLIPGGSGDASGYTLVGRVLADNYTVVTFDPRGNSRSAIHGALRDQRVEEHAEDAHLLLTEVGAEPAYVFGSSSGALVGLDLAARHPEQVRGLVAHEPPAATLLPDGERWMAFLREVHDLHQSEGAAPAMRKFAEGMGLRPQFEAQGEPPPQVREMLERVGANMEFFFAHEILSFSRYVPDFDALRAVPVVLAGGEESRGQMPYLAGAAVAERLGTQVVHFPGDHVGYTADPLAFAGRLHEVLAKDLGAS